MKKDSQEWQDWCKVYEYMKGEILGYDKDMKLPPYIRSRLQGLSEGKFMSNKKQKPQASYSYATILITMKICKEDIRGYISRNQSSFTDEKHKFNGIMVIIESEINDVVMRLKKAKKCEERAEKADVSHLQLQGASYKKENKKTKEKLNDLW